MIPSFPEFVKRFANLLDPPKTAPKLPATEPDVIERTKFFLKKYPVCPLCCGDWLSAGIQHTVDLGSCARYRCMSNHIIMEPLRTEGNMIQVPERPFLQTGNLKR